MFLKQYKILYHQYSSLRHDLGIGLSPLKGQKKGSLMKFALGCRCELNEHAIYMFIVAVLDGFPPMLPTG